MADAHPFIPFNKPFLTGKELPYIEDAHKRGQLAGDGFYTRACSTFLEDFYQCKKVLITHSCTAALEMAAILAKCDKDSEIVLPSFTFVSTANAFVPSGSRLRFADIDINSGNVDENDVISLLTDNTDAVVPVHYAGGSCNMDILTRECRSRQIPIIEDAAQAFGSKYKGKLLGTYGELGTLSFHETKNIISGEGGALIINSEDLVERAEIIREKGTNRSLFFKGMVDKYTWVDQGSSYLPGEITAAFLYAQLEESMHILSERKAIWQEYHRLLIQLEKAGCIQRPHFYDECEHNAHIYFLTLKDEYTRDDFIKYMRSRGVQCVFHYIPLHSSPFGKQYHCKHSTSLKNTDLFSRTTVRLPLWIGMGEHVESIVSYAESYFE